MATAVRAAAPATTEAAGALWCWVRSCVSDAGSAYGHMRPEHRGIGLVDDGTCDVDFGHDDDEDYEHRSLQFLASRMTMSRARYRRLAPPVSGQRRSLVA